MSSILAGGILTSAAELEYLGSGPQRHVYLIRGAGPVRYWPRAEVLISRLEGAGFTVSDFASSELKAMTDTIRCRHRQGLQQGPLVFLGYSSGADTACKVARELQADGICVDHVILIESTGGEPVPNNVKCCLNIYKSDPATDWFPVLRGVAITRDGRSTHLYNLDVRRHRGWEWAAETTHLTMPTSDRMQWTLLRFVQQIHEQAGE